MSKKTLDVLEEEVLLELRGDWDSLSRQQQIDYVSGLRSEKLKAQYRPHIKREDGSNATEQGGGGNRFVSLRDRLKSLAKAKQADVDTKRKLEQDKEDRARNDAKEKDTAARSQAEKDGEVGHKREIEKIKAKGEVELEREKIRASAKAEAGDGKKKVGTKTKEANKLGKGGEEVLKKGSDFKGAKSDADSVSGDAEADRKVVSDLENLSKMVQEAKAKGEKAPHFDLCQISIPGTNLFCGENKGIDRDEMPQFKTKAVAGGWADQNLDKDPKSGEVNAEPLWKMHLKSKGYAMEKKKVAANTLKATQRDLVGPKVVGMYEGLKGAYKNAASAENDEAKAEALNKVKGITDPIFVSKDGYILDGHHRWAAIVAFDIADGSGEDIEMDVIEVDTDIETLLDEANAFQDEIGLERKSAKAGKAVTEGYYTIIDTGRPYLCEDGACKIGGKKTLDEFLSEETALKGIRDRELIGNYNIIVDLQQSGKSAIRSKEGEFAIFMHFYKLGEAQLLKGKVLKLDKEKSVVRVGVKTFEVPAYALVKPETLDKPSVRTKGIDKLMAGRAEDWFDSNIGYD